MTLRLPASTEIAPPRFAPHVLNVQLSIVTVGVPEINWIAPPRSKKSSAFLNKLFEMIKVELSLIFIPPPAVAPSPEQLNNSPLITTLDEPSIFILGAKEDAIPLLFLITTFSIRIPVRLLISKILAPKAAGACHLNRIFLIIILFADNVAKRKFPPPPEPPEFPWKNVLLVPAPIIVKDLFILCDCATQVPAST